MFTQSINIKYRLICLTALLVLGASACISSKSLAPLETRESDQKVKSDSVFISLTAYDLSEDMSKILSTKNDEILVLLYEYQDSSTLSAPLFHKAFTIKEKGRAFEFHFEKAKANQSSKLLFLLIEQDFDRPVEQIDPVVRVQHQALLMAFRKRDYQRIRRFLGSEDLLGYWLIEDFQPDQTYTHKIEGVHKLDWYEYTVEIGRK